VTEADVKVGVLQFFGWRDRSVPLRSIYDMALDDRVLVPQRCPGDGAVVKLRAGLPT